MVDFTNIERFFKQKSVLSNLIAINIIVFLVLKIITLACLLFKIDTGYFMSFFHLPASFESLFYRRPWTIISYFFTHIGFFHILFNLIVLFWFGKIFLYFFKPKQLGGLYVLGGIAGGLLFMTAYNLFPYFKSDVHSAYLIGASASVMAIVFATAFYRKDYEINLLLLGRIKLIYFAFFILIIDFVIDTDNLGGSISHLGGALIGVWFAKAYLKGKDITSSVNNLIDSFVNLFTKKEKKQKQVHRRPEGDQEYNKKRSDKNKEIDRILDKIKKSGYNSLTEEEKKTLFNTNK